MVFCHLNIQSLYLKMDECWQFPQDTGKTLPLIFGMLETCFTESVTDGEVAVDSVRKGPWIQGHGGVLMHVFTKCDQKLQKTGSTA